MGGGGGEGGRVVVVGSLTHRGASQPTRLRVCIALTESTDNNIMQFGFPSAQRVWRMLIVC